MSSVELKVEIFRKIDSLNDAYLKNINQYISDLMKQSVRTDDWGSLSDGQKAGLIDAVNSIEEGNTIVHDQVISKYKRLYAST